MRIRRWPWRPADALAVGLAVAMIAGSTAVSWLTVFPPDGDLTFVDIEWYRRALDEVAAGRPMSSQLNYPPISLVLLSPLRGLPTLAGEQLWAGASIAVALLLAAITVRAATAATDQAHTVRQRALGMAVAAPLVLLSFPVSFNLTTGQLSIFVMALALVDASGLLPRRVQGSLVGFAAALKLTPLIFVPYYALTRQWRQLGVAGATFGALGVIGFALFPRDSVDFWLHPGAAAQMAGSSHLNVTILGILLQWPGDSLPMRITWLALAAGAGAAALWRARTHFLRGEQFQAAVVVGIASTAISPLGWSHYQQWQVVAAVWLILSGRPRNIAWGALLYVLFCGPYSMVVFGALRDMPLGVAGRAAIMIASLAVCLTGLPRAPGQPASTSAITDRSGGSCPTAGPYPAEVRRPSLDT